MSKPSHQQLEYIVNHVFLPPKLPHGAEPEDLAAESDCLLSQLVLDAALCFSRETGGMAYTPCTQNSRQWKVVTKMLWELVYLPLKPSPGEISQSLLVLSVGGVSNGQRTGSLLYFLIPVAGRFLCSACACAKRSHDYQTSPRCYEI